MSAAILNSTAAFAQTFLQLWFIRRFLSSAVSEKHFILLAAAIGTAVNLIPVHESFKSLMHVFLLITAGEKVLKTDRKTAAVCAVTAAVIMQLCFGICGCAMSMLIKAAYTPLPAFVIFTAGNTLPFVIAYGLYKTAAFNIPGITAVQNGAAGIILPLCLIFLIDIYINSVFYGNTIDTETFPPASVHARILAFRILCLASVISIIRLYGTLTGMQTAQREYELKKQYAKRSEMLYGKTVSFRHDIKNHLLAVKGLIDKNEYTAAGQYLRELCGSAGELSFPFSTGRPVIDVLLDEKLSSLENIDVSCSFKLPEDFEISDTCLCIIISNALDNAVNACNKISENRYIHISCRCLADMALFEFENSFDGKEFSEGTGLANIRAAAGKYRGKASISAEKNSFRLRIIFTNTDH